MPPWLRWLTFLALVGAAAFWWLTRPDRLDAAQLGELSGDAEAGERVFLAAGCASCHTAPDDESDGPPVLSGGQAFVTGFGTFYAPNVSPDPEHGIGAWSDAQVIEAMAHGIDDEGRQLYPAFPYQAYGHADLSDLADLVAYWRTLPASAEPSREHDLSFPYSIRRGVGLWKRLFLIEDWVLTGDLDPQVERGRYLVEALGHCGECHTPRNAAGGLITERWLQGAANPSGEGRIPGIDPGHLDWSQADIVAFLRTGLTPDYDSVGGEMVAVVDKIAQLPDADREAIAAYLKAVPAASDGAGGGADDS